MMITGPARRIALTLMLLLLAFGTLPVSAQSVAQDREAVRQAALDYVEAVYNVQPDRIKRSVHTSLVKRGFHRKSAGAPYVEMPMNYEQLLNLAANWNKDGRQDTSVKEVTVMDVLDQTAVAKVRASWGIDYLLLGKYEGSWKIVQILWQSPPQ